MTITPSMSLKIHSFKQNIPRIIGLVLLALVIIFFLRVMIWEHFYYQEKEGSTRATATSSASTGNPTVDETEITPEEINAYTVSPEKPRYLSIDKLGIHNARIIELGLTTSGQMDTPTSIFDAGWYRSSGLPGAGGTMMLDGHNGGPTKVGIFKNLPSLTSGDTITIERGDGTIFHYRVVENQTVLLSEADTHMAKMEQSPVPGTESISIITCTGDWSQSRQTYLSRQFLRAILAD